MLCFVWLYFVLVLVLRHKKTLILWVLDSDEREEENNKEKAEKDAHEEEMNPLISAKIKAVVAQEAHSTVSLIFMSGLQGLLL